MDVAFGLGRRIGLVFCFGIAASAFGQNELPLTQNFTMNRISPLDPTRNVTAPELESARHTAPAEEYIWTASDTAADAKIIYSFPGVTEKIEPHFFRTSFQVGSVPKVATLYLAGPRSVKVWINGQMAEQVESDLTSPLGMHVFAQDVAKFLKPWRTP